MLGLLVGSTSVAVGQSSAPVVDVPIASGSANLNITPKRLVLGQGARTGTVYIFNQGTAPATFEISLVERVMLPNGEIRPIDDVRSNPDVQPIIARLSSAQGIVLATPRRVTLAPGRGQTIRVHAKQPPKGTGEARTHLTVATVPPRDTGLTAEQARSQRADQFSFRVTSVFGISIPVIVRSGTADVRGAIENAAIAYADISQDGVSPAVRTPVLRLDVRRLGTSSLFGNVTVKSLDGRNRDTLGLARGIGVYPEIDRRMLQIPLQRVPRPRERLEITFTDDDTSPGRVINRVVLTAE